MSEVKNFLENIKTLQYLLSKAEETNSPIVVLKVAKRKNKRYGSSFKFAKGIVGHIEGDDENNLIVLLRISAARKYLDILKQAIASAINIAKSNKAEALLAEKEKAGE